MPHVIGRTAALSAVKTGGEHFFSWARTRSAENPVRRNRKQRLNGCADGVACHLLPQTRSPTPRSASGRRLSARRVTIAPPEHSLARSERLGTAQPTA